MKKLQRGLTFFALTILLLTSTMSYAGGKGEDLLQAFKASSEYSTILKSYDLAPAAVKLSIYKDHFVIAQLVNNPNKIITSVSYSKNGKFETTILELTTQTDIQDMHTKSNFTGVMALKDINGQVFNSATILNNQVITTLRSPTHVMTPITDCVAKKIDNMGWVEYGLCAITAPECLAGLVLICAGEIYT